METREFACSPEGMAVAQSFLEELDGGPKASVVFDEIVSNIVRCSGSPTFSIGLERNENSLTMVFMDAGQAFNPLTEVALPDVSAKLEDRSVGGLGIFLVQKMAKEVSYRRDANHNILTVVMEPV